MLSLLLMMLNITNDIRMLVDDTSVIASLDRILINALDVSLLIFWLERATSVILRISLILELLTRDQLPDRWPWNIE